MSITQITQIFTYKNTLIPTCPWQLGMHSDYGYLGLLSLGSRNTFLDANRTVNGVNLKLEEMSITVYIKKK